MAAIGYGYGSEWHLLHELGRRREAFARRQLLLPVDDNYFCRRRVSEGVSPTAWRHSVVVVGRSVAVKTIRAGAPSGAEAPAEGEHGASESCTPVQVMRSARPPAASSRLQRGRNRSTHRSSQGAIVDPEAASAVVFVTRWPPIGWRSLFPGASPAQSGNWGHRIPAARSDAPGDRSPRRSPSDPERSDPTAQTSNCW